MLLLTDPAIQRKIDELKSQQPAPYANKWFQQEYKDTPLSCIAYFSMEYMLSEGLPIYSGGLGNVAGDQLKAANDMGVPIAAVGLLYQRGYFRQIIGKDGGQEALYPFNDPGQLPIMPLRKPNGEWLRLQIVLPGYSVWLRTWEVRVGNVKLYLLDTNDVANYPAHRGITSELYGMTADEVTDCLAAIRLTRMSSLDGGIDSVGTRLDDPSCRPDVIVENEEQKQLLTVALSRLVEREQVIVTLYYLEDLRLKEIGVVLNLSESRVSRLLNVALFNLGELLRASNGLRKGE